MKNDLRFTGIVLEIFPAQKITAGTGKVYIKQEAVVEEVGEQYPNRGVFESFHEPANEKAKNKLDGVNEGDTVEIVFNMKANPYTTKPKDGSTPERRAIGGNQIWNITVTERGDYSNGAAENSAPPAPNDSISAGAGVAGGESDLPF